MIGERIKLLREKKGYTLTQLADLAGVSKSYLSYIERNLQTNPSLQLLSKLAITLETTLEYLLNGGEKKASSVTNNFPDEEWRYIAEKAIKEGMSKDDFIRYNDYISFIKWKNKQEEV